MMSGKQTETSWGFFIPFFTIITMLYSCPARGQEDLIVDATTVYLYGEHEYRDVRIVNGGKVTIRQPNGLPYYQGRLSLKCHSLLIDASSMIDGIGLGDNYGHIQLSTVFAGGRGGTYGGRGGTAHLEWYQWPVYGTVRGLDIDLGQGGSEGSSIGPFYGYQGFGGAGISIRAENAEVEGVIDVNGTSGLPSQYCPPRICPNGTTGGGGGAGGGLLLIAVSLQIGSAARITAMGGDGAPGDGPPTQGGYGGGGGRIKLFYETGQIAPSAVISVSQGLSIPTSSSVFPCTTCIQAEPGTIWIQQVPSIERLLHPSGDLNNDGIIDATDATILISHWHEADPTVTPWITWTPIPTITP